MLERIKIFQADRDNAFRNETAEYFGRLEDMDYLAGVDSDEDILAKIAKLEPNVVLLDLYLPEQGGFSTLQEIRSRWDRNSIVVIMFACSTQKETVLAQAASLGANYFILRPVDLVVLENRIRQLKTESPWAHEAGLPLQQVQEICKYYFDLIGVPPHYKGYRYLIEGIWLASIHPRWLNSVTKKLYPAIGQRFSTTGSQVERAMRYALDITWEKGNLDELYRLFPYEVRESKGKPTNSAFIAKMVDLISLEIGLEG